MPDLYESIVNDFFASQAFLSDRDLSHLSVGPFNNRKPYSRWRTARRQKGVPSVPSIKEKGLSADLASPQVLGLRYIECVTKL